LTFQLAAEYARQNGNKKVLVIDLCPQANSSLMLLGGMFDGMYGNQTRPHFVSTPVEHRRPDIGVLSNACFSMK